MNTRCTRTMLCLSLAAIALSGCNARDAVMEKLEADSLRRYQASLENVQRDAYVFTDVAWACATAGEARKGECESGKKYVKGDKVAIVGKAPADGVWRVAWWDAGGERFGFIAESALSEVPDSNHLVAMAKEVDDRIPESSRIPKEAMSFRDFTQNKALQSRRLVLEMRSSDQRSRETKDGAVRFLVYFPADRGSRIAAPVLFRFASKRWSS